MNGKVTHEYIPARDIFADYSYQRELNKGWLKKIVNSFDDSLVNEIVVSNRGNGTYAVIDGNHTVNAIRIVCGDSESVLCKVYDGLSIADEASMFRKLNVGRRGVRYRDILKANIAEGDETAIEYYNYLKSTGVPFSLREGRGFSCHKAILYSRKKYGDDVTKSAMILCEKSTKDIANKYCNVHVFMMCVCLVVSFESFDLDRMITSIKKCLLDGLPLHSNNVISFQTKQSADIIVREYNKGKRSSRLNAERIWEVTA